MGCIYYNNQENLNFNSAEHIFPNALGGKMKLPCDYVSKEANQYFSKLERKLFKGNTDFNFIRTFHMKNKKTAIFEIENNNVGYLKDGELNLTPCIILNGLNKKNVKIDLNFPYIDNLDQELENIFFEIKKNFDKIKINYQDIESEMAKIICYKEKREYKFEILINRKTDIKNLKKVFTSGKLEISKKTTNNIKNPRINYKFITDIQLYYKIFGKTAINLLAYSKGKEFVEHKDFENLKNKIFGKDNINLNKDINFLENKIDLKEIIFKAINDPFISISAKNIEKFNENYVNEGTCSSIIIQDNKSNIEAVFSVLGISFYILLIENSEIKIGNPIFYLINSKTRKELFSKNFAEELITYLK